MIRSEKRLKLHHRRCRNNDKELGMNIGFIGMAAALGLSALGSALGTGAASLSAVGGWKKCYANGRPAPFIMVAFSGAPLTQTIYGFLLMNFISAAAAAGQDAMLLLGAGIFGGLAIGLSAWMQGRAAAAASDALAETGKGTANYFIVIGIVETVALFTLVFLLLLLQ
jgi:V/A-type H+-transporting ATPase subunit K